MTTGTPPPHESKPYILPESIVVTIASPEGESLTLTSGNCSLETFQEADWLNHIAVAVSGDITDPQDLSVEHLFNRPDLIKALADLGFRHVTQRYPSPKILEAYTATSMEKLGREWDLRPEEGIHEVAFEDPIKRTTPLIPLELEDIGEVNATYANTLIRRYAPPYDIYDHILFLGVVAAAPDECTRIFDNTDMMEFFLSAGFPSTTSPYPDRPTVSDHHDYITDTMDTLLESDSSDEDESGQANV